MLNSLWQKCILNQQLHDSILPPPGSDSHSNIMSTPDLCGSTHLSSLRASSSQSKLLFKTCPTPSTQTIVHILPHRSALTVPNQNLKHSKPSTNPSPKRDIPKSTVLYDMSTIQSQPSTPRWNPQNYKQVQYEFISPQKTLKQGGGIRMRSPFTMGRMMQSSASTAEVQSLYYAKNGGQIAQRQSQAWGLGGSHNRQPVKKLSLKRKSNGSRQYERGNSSRNHSLVDKVSIR